LFLVDGADEINESDKRKLFLKTLEEFTKDNPAANIVLTSRLYSLDEIKKSIRIEGKSARKDAYWAIRPFEMEDIKSFCEKWYSEISRVKGDEYKVGELIEKIEGNSKLLELAGIPILLTALFYIDFSNRNNKLPDRIAELYRQCLKFLLCEFRANDRHKDKQIEWVRDVPHLSFLALDTLPNGRKIEKKYLVKRLDDSMTEMTQYKSDDIKDADDLFTRVAEREVLVKRGSGDETECFKFPHKSVHEYFAGLSIANGYYPAAKAVPIALERIRTLLDTGCLDESDCKQKNNMDYWDKLDDMREAIIFAATIPDTIDVPQAIVQVLLEKLDEIGGLPNGPETNLRIESIKFILKQIKEEKAIIDDNVKNQIDAL
jgi:hypothetical protein